MFILHLVLEGVAQTALRHRQETVHSCHMQVHTLRATVHITYQLALRAARPCNSILEPKQGSVEEQAHDCEEPYLMDFRTGVEVLTAWTLVAEVNGRQERQILRKRTLSPDAIHAEVLAALTLKIYKQEYRKIWQRSVRDMNYHNTEPQLANLHHIHFVCSGR